MAADNRTRCENCNFDLHNIRSCKHRNSNKHIRNSKSRERNRLFEEDDVIVFTEWFFRDKKRQKRYINYFRSSDRMAIKYKSIETHPPSDYINARVKKVCRYGLDSERIDINRLNK